jgi:hypothetical protein
MEVALGALEEPPVIPPVTDGADQLYVVFAGKILPPALLGVTLNEPLLQMASLRFAMAGLGLTVTVTIKVEPTHEPAAPDLGVTV